MRTELRGRRYMPATLTAESECAFERCTSSLECTRTDEKMDTAWVSMGSLSEARAISQTKRKNIPTSGKNRSREKLSGGTGTSTEDIAAARSMTRRKEQGERIPNMSPEQHVRQDVHSNGFELIAKVARQQQLPRTATARNAKRQQKD